ncbi:MAG: MBL fold metallo-hydrolase [Acidobacteriota bacterium]
MALSFTLLGSGSSGNATLVSDGDTHILVDVGLSGRETVRRLAQCGLSPQQISAIVVSHEHGDHCRGIAPFAKHLEVPVFITDGAYAAAELALEDRKRQRIDSGCAFEVRGILFTPFAVPHDAADPIAFCIEKDGAKIAIVLDLGYISNLVVERLRGCDAIVLESNHDINMLAVGPYPWPLKQRVKSRLGHLSNEDVAEYLLREFDGRARHVILAHLSEKNNLPELALLSARRALEERSTLLAAQTRLDLGMAGRISRTYRF